MRLPSTRTIGIAGVGLSLGVPAAAALGAPRGVWIGMAIAGGLCLAAALAHYLLVDCKQPAEQCSSRGRLEAHAGRGREILARIDKASEDYPVPFWGRGLIAQAEAMESAQPQATVLISDRDGWIAAATGLVEGLAPNLLDEYKADYAIRTPRVTAGVFYGLREPLRQRLDGLQRVIDATEDR
jgi:hypothetical protein